MARTFYALNNATGACTGLANRSISDETGPTVTQSVTVPASSTDAFQYSLTNFPADADWSAANYDVMVDVTTANMNVTLTKINVARWSSGCVSIATLGDLTGIGRVLGSTGSVTHTVSGAAAAAAVSGDVLYVRIGFTNSAMTDQAVSIKVTVITDAFDAPAQPLPRGTLVIRQAVMRATLH